MHISEKAKIFVPNFYLYLKIQFLTRFPNFLKFKKLDAQNPIFRLPKLIPQLFPIYIGDTFDVVTRQIPTMVSTNKVMMAPMPTQNE